MFVFGMGHVELSFKPTRLKKTSRVVGAEEGVAPDLQRVRMVKYGIIVIRTYVLVKGGMASLKGLIRS